MTAEGHLDQELALHYALDLKDVAIAVVGVYTEAELLQNIEWARRYKPLSAALEQAAITAGRRLSETWAAHFGPVK